MSATLSRSLHLVSVAQLHAAALAANAPMILDASWHMPGPTRRDAAAEFLASRIPGASRLDIDGVSDSSSPLPHMLPPAASFAASMASLGVSRSRGVVVYDSLGLFSAARAWWMLRAFGHPDVRVLEGGLPAWVRAGLPTESGPPPPRSCAPEAWALDASRVRTMAQVRACVADPASAVQLVDARPSARFAGDAPEPRAGLASGHIPRARSLPFGTLVGADGALLPREGLAAAFAAAGVDVARSAPVVASCGSGVTACVLALALETLGRKGDAVYDGSWAEWGQVEGGGPIERGPPPAIL